MTSRLISVRLTAPHDNSPPGTVLWVQLEAAQKLMREGKAVPHVGAINYGNPKIETRLHG